MTAAEARALTQKNLAGKTIAPVVAEVDRRIEEAVAGGRFYVHDPQLDHKRALSLDEVASVRMHYQAKGYLWTEHPDPDPGHPCSRPYTKLSW